MENQLVRLSPAPTQGVPHGHPAYPLERQTFGTRFCSVERMNPPLVGPASSVDEQERPVRAAIETISSIGDIDPLMAEWEALAASCPTAHFNQGAIYARVAIERALIGRHEVRLIWVKRAGLLLGVWPLVIRREGLMRVARPVSCGSNEEYTDPLVAPWAEAEALEAVMAKASELPCDALCIMNVKVKSVLADRLGQEPWRELPQRADAISGYAIKVSRFSGWDEYTAQSRSRASSLRRKLNGLSRLGQVKLGWCHSPQHAKEVIDWAFAAKRQWMNRKLLYSPWLMSKKVPDFFASVAHSVDLENLPLFTYLEVDGCTIAAQINLIGGSVFESFIVARDEKYNKYSPGEILTEYCTELAIKKNLDFDLRIMTDEYKKRRSDCRTDYTSYKIYMSRLGQAVGPLQTKAARWLPRFVRGAMILRGMAMRRHAPSVTS